jgi:prophage regulatory protein
MQEEEMTNRILRLKDVATLVGVSETTIWRLEKAGEFPARRRISGNSVGYLASDIQKWIESREPVAAEGEK